jgi:hypothetical protein
MTISLPTPESIIAFSFCLGVACAIFGALLGQAYESEKREGTRALRKALRFAYEESDGLREIIRHKEQMDRIESFPLFNYEDHK